MRGRKPDATAVRIWKGNTSKKPIVGVDPEHATIDPTVPDELADESARREWVRIVAALGKGHVTTVDRATLIAYCIEFGRWVALEKQAAKQPPTLTNRFGDAVINPIVTLAQSAHRLMVKTAAELGITPSTRARIRIPAGLDAPIDEFAKYQQKRRGA